jgi:hypothetical protein
MLSLLLLVLVAVLAPGLAVAQPWSGIIAPQRATDWRTAGATIPTRTTICATIAPYTGTAATINNAIAACPSGQVVQLQAGTFTLSTGISHQKSNVTLRGAGAASTKLIINGGAGGCGLGANSAVRFCSGAGGTQVAGNMSQNGTTATLSSFVQGANTATLGTVSGLVAGPVGTGSIIMLDQLNDAADGFPAAGDLYVCEVAGFNCSNQGSNNWGRKGRSQVEVKTVTAINGNTITFTPGLQAPNWRSAQNPSAWWNNATLQNAGLEDLTIDSSGFGGNPIQVKDVSNSWITGVRSIMNASTSGANHIVILHASHLTIRSNYFYGPLVFGLGQYTLNTAIISDSLYENNILHDVPSGILPNDPGSGNVYSYNYVHNTGAHCNPQCSPVFQFHSGTIFMDLLEGNNMGSAFADVIHGVHYMVTMFRNHLDGYSHMVATPTDGGIALMSNNRFFNLIGNVIGHSHFTTYQVLQAPNDDAIYMLGWQGNGSGFAVANDGNVSRTLMRWGNWDSVTSTNDNGSNDATGIRFVASEVPSGIANFANPVPGSQILPKSFYLSAQPTAWWSTPWGTPPWPPIGPEVASSNITTATGGHANKIPARLCFENTDDDPAYPSSSPGIKGFDAATCYIGGTVASPLPPTGLTVN